MKKNYFLTLLITLCFSVLTFGQGPVITAIVDGDCSGGNPKLLEIYANGTVDFTQYSMQNQTNANTTWGSNLDLTPLGTVTNAFVYITTSGSATALASDFPAITPSTPKIESNVINLNGDDRIRIVLTSSLSGTVTVIDQFGEEGVTGAGKSWEYSDSYAKRKDATGPDAGFNEANWTFGGKAFLDTKGVCQGGSDTFQALIGGIGTYKKVASTNPSISFASPIDNQIFPSGTTNIQIAFDIQNFTLSGDNGSEMTDNSGDGYIIGTLSKDGVVDGSKSIFSSTVDLDSTVDGETYMIVAELVDNAGNSLSPKIEATVNFSVSFPCDLVLENILTTCDTSTSGTDTYSGSISFTGGNTGITYTITAPNGVTVGGDNPNTKASGTITFSGMTEGTNADITIVGGAGSSCNYTRTLYSPTCYSLPILETFDYTANTNLISNPLWQDASTSVTPNDIQVKEPILGNYYSSAQLPDPTGKMISLVGGGSDPYLGFNEKTTGIVYASFLFHVTDMTNFNNTNGGYFAILGDSNSGFRARLWVKDPTAGTTNEGLQFNVGISASGATQFNTNFTANKAEPVFVVMSYNLDNDEVKLWTVPNAATFGTNTPPAADITLTDGNGDAINRFILRQDSDSETPSIDFDELRIGTTWTDVTSNPVASVGKNSIKGFTAYPNPITDTKFTITSASSSKKEIAIFNVLGKKVLSSSFSGVKSTVDVSTISSGIYILKVTEDGKTATKKLVIR